MHNRHILFNTGMMTYVSSNQTIPYLQIRVTYYRISCSGASSEGLTPFYCFSSLDLATDPSLHQQLLSGQVLRSTCYRHCSNRYDL